MNHSTTPSSGNGSGIESYRRGAPLMRTVAVLGAGLQGVCVALAMQAKGWRVRLIDREPQPMLRASLRNEGKVHLGFVYANDRSFRTSRLMLESGLSFASLIDAWLPRGLEWTELRSRPFTYLIMRDSLLQADDILAHYERVQQSYQDVRGPDRHYLGLRPDRLWRPAQPLPQAAPDAVVGTIQTAEVALNLVKFRDRIVRALGPCENVSGLFHRSVRSVSRTGQGFVVEGCTPDGDSWSASADVVVNCLWNGRLEIDRQMSIVPDRPWVFRLKYRVLAELPPRLAQLPSLTLVLGPYGDVVPMADGSYVSWYAACRRGWSRELCPPAGWEAPCSGVVDPDIRASLPGEVYGALDRIIPGMSESRTVSVDAGVIFSWGHTDVDRMDSELHQRFAIGVHENDGYFSIDTGKLTCAPLFASRVAARL